MAFLQASNGATGTTTATDSLVATAVSTILAFAWVGSNFAPTLHSVSDGTAYSPQGTAVTDAGNNIWTQIFTLQNVSGGTHTVVFTSDSGASVFLVLVEDSAPSSGAIIGVNGVEQNSPTTTPDNISSGSITIAVPVTLIGMSADTSNVSAIDQPTAGTGFTLRKGGNNGVMGSWSIESKSVSSTAAATFTAVDGTSRFCTLAAATAEPTGGGSTVHSLMMMGMGNISKDPELRIKRGWRKAPGTRFFLPEYRKAA